VVECSSSRSVVDATNSKMMIVVVARVEANGTRTVHVVWIFGLLNLVEVRTKYFSLVDSKENVLRYPL